MQVSKVLVYHFTYGLGGSDLYDGNPATSMISTTITFLVLQYSIPRYILPLSAISDDHIDFGCIHKQITRLLMNMYLTVGRLDSNNLLKKISSLGLLFRSGTLVAPICLLTPRRLWFTTTRLNIKRFPVELLASEHLNHSQ